MLKVLDLVAEVLFSQTLYFTFPPPPRFSPIHVANPSTFFRWIICFLQEAQPWYFSPALPSPNIVFIFSTGTTYLYSQMWNRLKYLVKFRAVFLSWYLALMFLISVINLKKGFSAQRLLGFFCEFCLLVFFLFSPITKILWSNKILSLLRNAYLLMSSGCHSYSDTSTINILTSFGKRVYSLLFCLAVCLYYGAGHNVLHQIYVCIYFK